MQIYVINNIKNEYGERLIQNVEQDEVIHHKSGIYVTKNHGFVRDADTIKAYTAIALRKLLMENAYNGHFSRELNMQYTMQKRFEQKLMLQRA